MDSVAAVAVVPVESAIAGKRLTCSNRRKGAMKAWHPFFVCFSWMRPQETSIEVTRETDLINEINEIRSAKGHPFFQVFPPRMLNLFDS